VEVLSFQIQSNDHLDDVNCQQNVRSIACPVFEDELNYTKFNSQKFNKLCTRRGFNFNALSYLQLASISRGSCSPEIFGAMPSFSLFPTR